MQWQSHPAWDSEPSAHPSLSLKFIQDQLSHFSYSHGTKVAQESQSCHHRKQKSLSISPNIFRSLRTHSSSTVTPALPGSEILMHWVSRCGAYPYSLSHTQSHDLINTKSFYSWMKLPWDPALSGPVVVIHSQKHSYSIHNRLSLSHRSDIMTFFSSSRVSGASALIVTSSTVCPCWTSKSLILKCKMILQWSYSPNQSLALTPLLIISLVLKKLIFMRNC